MKREPLKGRTLKAVWILVCLALSGCLLPSSDQPPVAAVTALPRDGYVPLSVAFDASGSFDPEGKGLSFRWDFGDGQTAVGPTATHLYNSVGEHTARISVTDSEGNVATKSVSIQVRSVPDGYILRRFQWERDGQPRVWEILIPYNLYQMYKGRVRTDLVDNYAYDSYVIDSLDDPTLKDYARWLWTLADKNEDQFIQETLAFVQGGIRYQADPPGVEHPLYPLETLTDGQGDCEDTAILFVSLLQAMEVPSKLAFVDTDGDRTPDHVLAFVAISSALQSKLVCAGDAKIFVWDNVFYALAETAVDHGVFALGCDPWGLDEDDVAALWSFPSL